MNEQQFNFTPNETDIFRRLACGETVTDIARDWGVSKTVVYRSLERARGKLGAATSYHAVAMWLSERCCSEISNDE